MITNDQGLVALKYFQPMQKLVSDVPSGADGYVFVVKADISMSWVSPVDVDNILNRKKVRACCPGARNAPAFDYANESDVRRWTNNGGA